MIIAKFFAGLRKGRLVGRSVLQRGYLRIAFPSIRCHPSVRFGRGVHIRAFAGGSAVIGANTRFDDFASVQIEFGRLEIGRNCLIGRGNVIVCVERIAIGDGSLLAEYVTLHDHDHRHQGAGSLDRQGWASAPIVIGEEVWLAAKVSVMKGVEIAPHAVVGANAVVSRSLPERGVYAGVPAKRIG